LDGAKRVGLPGWDWGHYKERKRRGQDVEKRNPGALLVGMQTGAATV